MDKIYRCEFMVKDVKEQPTQSSEGDRFVSTSNSRILEASKCPGRDVPVFARPRRHVHTAAG